MKYDIDIHPSGVKYQASVDDTILDAALKSRIFLEHSCRKGECGLCSATLLSGLVKNEQGNTVTSGEVLTCCSYPQSPLQLKANFYPELAEIDCLTFPCKVVSCTAVADDIVILTLRYPPNVSFNYIAGQYIDLIYKGVRRSYSIANVKAETAVLELHIRLIKNGEFSQLLMDGCDEGQLMRIEGPKGTFFVRESSAPIIFIAGGTGFAPIKAMFEGLLKNNIKRECYIYWGMVNAKRFYMNISELWEKTYSHIHYVPVVSLESDVWTGRKGLVHEAVLQDFPDLSAYHVYACGSPLMINSAKEAFIAQGLNIADFYADIFVSSKES